MCRPNTSKRRSPFFLLLLCVSQDGNVTKQTSHQVGCMHKAGGCLCSCDAFVAASCEFPDQFRVSAEACGFKCYNNNKQWNIFMQASGNQDPSFWRPSLSGQKRQIPQCVCLFVKSTHWAEAAVLVPAKTCNRKRQMIMFVTIWGQGTLRKR